MFLLIKRFLKYLLVEVKNNRMNTYFYRILGVSMTRNSFSVSTASAATGVPNQGSITRRGSLTTLHAVENTQNCLTQNLRRSLSVSNIGRVLKSSGADLEWDNPRGVALNGFDFRLSNFRGKFLRVADLSNAQLPNLYSIVGSNFAGAKLDGATINLALPTNWADECLDRYLNHEANDDKSRLMTINTIDDKYAALKLDLVRSLLEAIDKPTINLAPYRNNFLCLLTPVFLGDEKIKQFLADRIIKPTIDQANSQPWVGVSKNVCQAFLNYLESTDGFDLIANNGFFVQLILNSMSLNDEELKKKAETLYEKYLSYPSIQPLTQQNDFGAYGEHAVDWADPKAANYILANDSYRMMITQNNLTAMLKPDKHTEWGQFFLFYYDVESNRWIDAENKKQTSLGAIFKALKIFDAPYQFAQRKVRFTKL